MDKITHKVRCEQWTNIIKECLASGMNKTAWCREHGISDKSFFYWQHRLREEALIFWSTQIRKKLPFIFEGQPIAITYVLFSPTCGRKIIPAAEKKW